MSRYAIVEDNKVTNLIEWDGETSTWTPPTGATMVAIGVTDYGVDIGQDYDGTKIVVPDSVDTRTLSDCYEQLRTKRNKKLVASDWSQYPDSPLDSTKKAEWATYRQALRDLPVSASPKLDSNGDLDMTSVTWPTPPS